MGQVVVRDEIWILFCRKLSLEQPTYKMWVNINCLALELNIYSLAHHLCKM